MVLGSDEALSGRRRTTGAPTWECPAGVVRGWRTPGVLRATGIRYARAERFGRPSPEPRSAAVIDATRWAPACPQAPSALLQQLLPGAMGDLTVDEHCQCLSVTVPEDAVAGDRLPVMVWIHGGSYTSGAGDAPVFDPAALVREQRVVVVAVTYRLGLFGFLGSREGRPANLGLLDQLEALRWVRANIAAFGGDPANVTLFGQSAGGDAVAHLMVAEGADGLFRRAIIQSAPFGIVRGREEMSAAMAAEAANVAPDAPVEAIVAAQERVAAKAAPFGLRASMPFGVQYGFDPLPAEGELDDAWRRVAASIDVLVGSTAREAAFFVPAVPPLEGLVRRRGPARAVLGAAVRGATRKVYGAGVASFSRRHRQAGGRGYRYRLVWGPSGSRFAAAHTLDMPLLFGDRAVWEGMPLVAGADWAQVEARGRQLRRLWAEFARSGQLEPGRRRGLITIRPLSPWPRSRR
jgi:para-nitrobenzyl esterase